MICAFAISDGGVFGFCKSCLAACLAAAIPAVPFRAFLPGKECFATFPVEKRVENPPERRCSAKRKGPCGRKKLYIIREERQFQQKNLHKRDKNLDEVSRKKEYNLENRNRELLRRPNSEE